MIVLASASLWRKRLWNYMKEDVVVLPSMVDEEMDDGVDVGELVSVLSHRKAMAVYERIIGGEVVLGLSEEVWDMPESWWVIGADTVIFYNGEVIGKPKSHDDAKRIIYQLSGETHQVLTGVTVVNEVGEFETDFEQTNITLNQMSVESIEKYLASGEWEGKAGGYQILKSIQPHIVEIDGGVSNVIGMPMKLTVSLLERMGCVVSTSSEMAMQEYIGFLD